MSVIESRLRWPEARFFRVDERDRRALNISALFQFYEPMRTAMPPVKRQIDGTSSICLK
jgi:hypothetical protein